MQPINVSIDICSLFGGALCPLPLYTFNGSDSLSLPKNLDIQSQIPDIAYHIPDLEAYAQLTLTDVKSGDVKACLQTTLSNGWSTHQYAVEWATGAFAIFAFALALSQSILDGPLALAPIRLLHIISLFQAIAVTGLLGLNFPSLYHSFTLNFSWALGLFPASADSPIQHSINRMRHLTGGGLSNASDDGAISFVNRKLSPYNSASYVLPQSLLASFTSMPKVDLANYLVRNRSDLAPQVLVGGSDVATVTGDSSNVLQAGIPIYTNTIGIATANAFMTIFFMALIITVLVLGILALIYGVTVLLCRTSVSKRYPRITEFRDQFPSFARAWGLLTALVVALPILIFTFYQWTLKDSWLSVFLSVLLLIAMMAIILPSAFCTVRSSLPTTRWGDRQPTLSVAPFTAPYRHNRVYYIIPLLIVMTIKAMVTSFAHAHGMTQAIFFVVLEFLLFLTIVVLKPFTTRRTDILAGYLCLTRLVCSGLMIAFAESLAVKPIPRVAIGAITAVIFSVAVIVLFINMLVNLGLWRLFLYVFTCGRRGHRNQRSTAHAALASQPSDPSLTEKRNGVAPGVDWENKDNATVATKPSQYYVQRPGNPSPPSSASLTPNTPLSSTTSTTLGETLPHRWSFQHSRPPSVSTDAPHSPAYTYRTSTASSPISGQRHSRNISSSYPTPLEERPEDRAV